jgi:hypothetical protein
MFLEVRAVVRAVLGLAGVTEPLLAEALANE